ncbi:solute carrier family 66 member 3 isoform X3 [Pseudophryne corroboree]|uniref:solute carrier family 66 member 3 isoform X3 n=1 Tax=Pseudophryne corroboree TaxID=495146 RepID=UPI003081AD7C
MGIPEHKFLVFLRYQIYYDYPMETYLEYPILIAQDAILLLFIFHYSGSVRNALFYFGMFFGLWNILVLQKWIIDLALNLCTVISASSKFLQLQHLWSTQDSGQASALTWGMATYTCISSMSPRLQVPYADTSVTVVFPRSPFAPQMMLLDEARIFTTLMTTGDKAVLLRFVVMLILNTWVTLVILKYRKTTDKKEDKKND